VQQNGVDLAATPLTFGRPLAIDAATGVVQGGDDVQRLLRGSYREGFVVPESV